MNIHELNDYVLSQWEKLFPNKRKPSGLNHFLIWGSYGKHCKTNILLFEEGQSVPCCVARIPMFTPNGFLANEYNNLTELSKLPDMKLRVPGVLDYWGQDANRILIETPVEGIPIRKSMKQNPEKIFQQVTRFLIQTSTSSEKTPVFTEDWFDLFVKEPVNALSMKLNSGNGSVIKKLDFLIERLHKLAGSSIPSAISHNDFRVSNLLTANNELRVLDWEFSSLRGYPLLDVLHFAVDAIVEIEEISYRKAVHKLIRHESTLETAIQKMISQYSIETGIDTNWLPEFYLLFALHRYLLATQITFPLQSHDGIEWTKESQDTLLAIVESVQEMNSNDNAHLNLKNG